MLEKMGGGQIVDVLAQMQPDVGTAEQFCERALSLLDRSRPQVVAVKHDKVERVQHCRRAAISQQVEIRDAALVASHHLAIDQARAAGQRTDRG